MALFLNSVLQWNEFLYIKSSTLFLALSSYSIKKFLFFSSSPSFLLPFFPVIRWQWAILSIKAHGMTFLIDIHFIFLHYPDLIYSYFLDDDGYSYTLNSWDGSRRITFIQRTWELPNKELRSHNQRVHFGIPQTWAGIQVHLPCRHVSEVRLEMHYVS